MKRQTPFQLRMNQNLTDINPVIAGESLTFAEDGPPNLMETYENYMIHYIRCGRGTLHYKGQTQPLHAGQLLILPPGVSARFHPLPNSRWALRWVAFSGVLAHRFSELPPVIDAPPGTFAGLCDLNGNTEMLAYKLASEVFFLYANLLKPQKQRLIIDSVEWIMDYVKKNYMNPITVAGIAEELGLDPDYLTRKFKKKANMNIQSYILQTRMTNAKQYLVLGYSVKEAAALCGFSDASGFCRAFKKYEFEHRSPSQWQKYVIAIHQKRTGSPTE